MLPAWETINLWITDAAQTTTRIKFRMLRIVQAILPQKSLRKTYFWTNMAGQQEVGKMTCLWGYGINGQNKVPLKQSWRCHCLKSHEKTLDWKPKNQRVSTQRFFSIFYKSISQRCLISLFLLHKSISWSQRLPGCSKILPSFLSISTYHILLISQMKQTSLQWEISSTKQSRR